ncbi:hypothetical protein CVT26_009147 [Gymnopilus dilepis]|uniref:VWFA domain-containing protein n=1 Tax=Gymnopilus dilepis TaxID=231916 RepID=A0A409Y9X0_9AGAR|nr:hypothetical protein CVT26_009147 [Gymnopilus dilepis]
MSTPPGCGFISFGADGSPTYLPLTSVSAHVHIIDTFARVVLTQSYTNSNIGRSSATQYAFPVPAGGAVCAFNMKASSGQVVSGVVKERSQAKNEYDAAILDNQWAGLLCEATSDVFVISMGAIAPQQDIEVTIMYVAELTDGDLPGYDQVEFRLQTFITNRYGRPPKELLSASSSTTGTVFDLTAEIKMTSEIISLSSPSHPSVTIDKRSWKDPRTSMYTARVRLGYDVSSYLDKDFVLSIRSARLGQPRCIAERRSSEGTIAMSLTFVPSFELDQLVTQEYIFLIDRSGSMDLDNRIDHAKDALLILLKSLPKDGTLFNVFSFGDWCTWLWNSSQPYNSSTLAAALQHVNSMEANMHGTEIKDGLNMAIMSRNTHIPTSVFVLTDGAVYDNEVDSIFSLIETEVQKAGIAAGGRQLRIFSLGVGDAASTALCEGIARRGHGVCLMTAHSVDISQKCARLLSASTVPSLGSMGDIMVDWGYVPAKANSTVRAERQSRNQARVVLFNEQYDPTTRATRKHPVLPEPPKVQQAPTDVPELYPANRFTVYAILSDTNEIPKTVKLLGRLPNGSSLSLPPVVVCEAIDEQEDFPPLIHTLAANRLITELEDGNTASQGAFDETDEDLREVVIEAAVVRLSEAYHLASQFASFIAVEESTKDFRDPDSGVSLDSDPGDVQLDGLDGKSIIGDDAESVHDDEYEDESDILDGKDEDEFYSAFSSAASDHSLSMALQQPQSSSVQARPASPSNVRSRGPEHVSHSKTSSTSNLDHRRRTGSLDSSQLPAAQLGGPSPVSLYVQDQGSAANHIEEFGRPTKGNEGAPIMPVGEEYETRLLRAEALDSQSPPMSWLQDALMLTQVESSPPPQSSLPLQLLQEGAMPAPWVPPGEESEVPVFISDAEASEGSKTTATTTVGLSVCSLVAPYHPAVSETRMTPLAESFSETAYVSSKAESEELSACADILPRVSELLVCSHVEELLPSPVVAPNKVTPTSLLIGSDLPVSDYLEDDLLGLSEPPTVGSPAYESIDSVLSRLPTLTVGTAVRDHELPERGVSSPARASFSLIDALCPSPVIHSTALDFQRQELELWALEAESDGESDIEELSLVISHDVHPNAIWIPPSANNDMRKKPVDAVAPSKKSVPMVSVAQLQQYDGSFDLDDKLCQLMGKKLSLTKLNRTIPPHIRRLREAGKVWATVLAAAFMKKHLGDSRETWIGLWQKAATYVKSVLGDDCSLSSLIDEASKLL